MGPTYSMEIQGDDFGSLAMSDEHLRFMREALAGDIPFKNAQSRLEERFEKSGLSKSGLVKAGAEFGTGPVHGTNFSGAFTPLVVQDIDLNVRSEAYRQEQLVGLRDVPVKKVNSPVHEVITVEEHGDTDIDVFFEESGAPSIEESVFNRKVNQIRFLGVRRQVSDVATVTGIAGEGVVTKAALEREEKSGALSLNLKREIALWQARRKLTPRGYDGVLEQIKNGGGYVRDMGGAKLSLAEIIYDSTKMASPTRYGLLEMIYIPGQMYGALVHEATSAGRYTQPLVPGQVTNETKNRANELILTPQGLTVIGSYGQVIALRPAEYISPQAEPPKRTAAAGEGPPAVTLATLVGGAPSVAAHATSRFNAASAGTYRYLVIAYGDKGRSISITTLDVIVGAGDRVKFDWADAGLPASGNGSVRSYALYRSTKDRTDGFKHVGRFERNALGASSGTVFYDDNSLLPGGVNVAGLTYADEAIYMAQLLPTIRRPLAALSTAQPFLLMTFESPHVAHAKKQMLYHNCDPSL